MLKSFRTMQSHLLRNQPEIPVYYIVLEKKDALTQRCVS